MIKKILVIYCWNSNVNSIQQYESHIPNVQELALLLVI